MGLKGCQGQGWKLLTHFPAKGLRGGEGQDGVSNITPEEFVNFSFALSVLIHSSLCLFLRLTA